MGEWGGSGEIWTAFVSLLQRLSSDAQRLSAVELDDMLERERGTQSYDQLEGEISVSSAQQQREILRASMLSDFLPLW